MKRSDLLERTLALLERMTDDEVVALVTKNLPVNDDAAPTPPARGRTPEPNERREDREATEPDAS